MPRILGLSLFLAVVFLLVGSTHYYIWARLIRDVGLPAPFATAATCALILLGLSMPAAMLVARFSAGPWAKGLVTVAFCWMGGFFILLCLLVAADVARVVLHVVLRLAQDSPVMQPERRLWLARGVGGAVAALATGAAGVALRNAARGPEVARVAVTLTRLPKALHGMTIAQISDLHVATLLGRPYVEEVVARTNALKPDVIAITGDLIDGSVAQLADAVAPLAGLQAEHGVFFVTGNHEYYSGVQQWLAELARLGIRTLRNERVRIGRGEDSFDLAGVDDWTASAFGQGHGADLPAALQGRDAKRELVLLAHQPKAIHEAANLGVGLMLSGHTHGGQIWPFGYLVRLAQPYVQGLARHGATQIYVNRGTGYWGPPMRLGAPPEITLVELQAV